VILSSMKNQFSKIVKRDRFIKRSLFILLASALSLEAKTINVPGDHLTIRSAVKAAEAGDVIEVEDGIYFERNIALDKAITLRAKNIFGPVIYGSATVGDAIFFIRAPVELSGFVLKNAYVGIIQRDSPDVAWNGRDLAVLNSESGINVNDREAHVGTAILERIIIADCISAISTNDARSVSLRKALIARCRGAFNGTDHLSFTVEEAVVADCPELVRESHTSFPPPATNAIAFGRDVHFLDPLRSDSPAGDIGALVRRLLGDERRPREAAPLLTLADIILGELYLQRDDPLTAERLLRRVLQSASPSASGLGEMRLRSLSLLAEIARRRRPAPPDVALALYRQAISEIDAIVRGFPLKLLQRGFFEDKIEVYESLIALLCALHREDPAKGYAREAFFYSEKSKAVGYLEEMRLAHTGESLRTRIRKSEQLPALGDRISGLLDELRHLDLPTTKREALIARLSDAEAEFEATLFEMGRIPSSLSLSPPAPPRYEQLGPGVLPPDCAIIEYFLGDRQTFAFFLTADALDVAVLPPPDVLRPYVSNYLLFLSSAPSASEPFLGETGSRLLAGILLEPFKERLGRRGLKKIIIIPDDALNLLPFETLKLSARARYLVEDFEIRYARSVASLTLDNRPRGASTDPVSKDLLAVANPGPSPKKSIRFVDHEVQAISRFFAASRTTLLTGKGATEEAFKRASDGGRHRIIHLAAHGEYHDRSWWRSGLFLGGGSDGWLNPHDVLGLDLDADLVVLSGCGSGLGRIERGEGLLGLMLVFSLAGARSVLTSLWDVEDGATARFMESFYRSLTQGGTAENAIRRTKLEMIASGYTHPSQWAAFVVR